MWFFRIFVAGVLFLYGGTVLPVEYRMGKVKFVFLSEECGRGLGGLTASVQSRML